MENSIICHRDVKDIKEGVIDAKKVHLLSFKSTWQEVLLGAVFIGIQD